MQDAFHGLVSGFLEMLSFCAEIVLKALHWAEFGAPSHAVPLWLSQISSSAHEVDCCDP